MGSVLLRASVKEEADVVIVWGDANSPRNEDVHGKSRIMKRKHDTYCPSF